MDKSSLVRKVFNKGRGSEIFSDSPSPPSCDVEPKLWIHAHCLPVVENDCVLDGLLLGVGIAATTTAAAAAAAPTAATERTAHTTSRTETELKTIQCVYIFISVI
jgi:hypothetical protein